MRTRKLDLDVTLNVLELHDCDMTKAAKTLRTTRATIYSLLAVNGLEIGRVVRKIRKPSK